MEVSLEELDEVSDVSCVCACWCSFSCDSFVALCLAFECVESFLRVLWEADVCAGEVFEEAHDVEEAFVEVLAGEVWWDAFVVGCEGLDDVVSELFDVLFELSAHFVFDCGGEGGHQRGVGGGEVFESFDEVFDERDALVEWEFVEVCFEECELEDVVEGVVHEVGDACWSEVDVECCCCGDECDC